MRICGIYCITNIVNNKKYVGQSTHIHKRWYDECYRAAHERTVNDMPLYQAIAKYGKENFLFEVLEECAIEQLNERETYWINYFNSYSPNGYNIIQPDSKIGKINYCLLCSTVINKESKYCISCSNIVKRHQVRPSKEDLAKMIYDTNFTEVGRMFHVTDNTIRDWCRVYHLPTHTKELKNWYRTEILGLEPIAEIVKIKNQKPIIQQFDKENNFIAEFNTPTEACRSVQGSKASHITEVCKGVRKTAYGYIWKYKE